MTFINGNKMVSEKKKKAIILALALSAFLIGIVATSIGPTIVPLARRSSTWLFYTIRLLIILGLIYAVGAGIAAIAVTVASKPSSRLFQVFSILISTIAIVYAFSWLLGLYAITTLKP